MGSEWKETVQVKKSKNPFIIVHGGPWVCEKSRLQHFLHIRFTEDDEVVRLMHWPTLTPGKLLVLISDRG
jgi:hypothetical protein